MEKEGSYRFLAKNIGILTLSSFATKLLSFFLVPLYTSILTTEEYGFYDLTSTIIGLMVPILTLNISDGVFRYAMDRDCDQNAVFAIGLRHAFIGTLLISAGLICNWVFGLFPIASKYEWFLLFIFLLQALNGVITAYARGNGYIADISVSSVITSIVIIGSNILFLLVFQLGLDGYFLANLLGPLVQCCYLLFRINKWKRLRWKHQYRVIQEQMLNYSRPMIANTIAWWVNNTSDRLVVTWFCGIAENGIYSVGSKIPSILNIFQTIFAQAWSLSAVKDYDPEDTNGFFRNTYSAYNCVMTIICSGIIMCNRILARFLYANDFYQAWVYVPFLTIAIVFGSLSGYLGGVFSAVKDSKVFSRSSVIGAVSNVVLNLVLTPLIGALGAAIATTICYCIVWAIRMQQSRKYIKLRINLARDIATYGILILQSVALLLFPEETWGIYAIELSLFMLIVVAYCGEIKQVFQKTINGLLKK